MSPSLTLGMTLGCAIPDSDESIQAGKACEAAILAALFRRA
jgi:hypothetical protein